MAQCRMFHMPPALIIGSGASGQVGEEARKMGEGMCLIVTDDVLLKLGVVGNIKQTLSQSGIAFAIYSGVSTEPTVEFVEEGLSIFRESGCHFILAIGGGSAIDAAKAISVMASNTGSIVDYQGINRITRRGVPLIAIPTTAGTGSEVTQAAIINDTKRDVKMLLMSPFLVPQEAIVDPLLTLSMPRSLTAATGIDALTHAIEAYVSVKAQPMSDIFALSAIELICGNLREAWSNGNNIEAREKMMLGALQAGIAFGNSSVALVHGMSRPIGACFHIPHGVSNAALLSVVTEFSLMGNPVRYAQVAKAMRENTDNISAPAAADLAIQSIKRLVKDIEIPTLAELGIDKGELSRLAPKMAEDAIASGSPANNPRKATKEEIIQLYNLAYAYRSCES